MIQRLRAILATLVEGISSRFDLAAVELEDLLARVAVMVALLLAGAFTAAFALLFLSWTLVEAMPQNYHWLGALLVTLVYAGASAWAWCKLKRCIREMPAPFSTIRDVLRRDLASLRKSAAEEENPAPTPPPTPAP
jgi:uncharacterized membrane protein YqjE